MTLWIKTRNRQFAQDYVNDCLQKRGSVTSRTVETGDGHVRQYIDGHIILLVGRKEDIVQPREVVYSQPAANEHH